MLNKLIEILNSGKVLPGGSICTLEQPLTFFRLSDGCSPDENGAALLSVERNMLHVYAAFRDSDIHNSARRNNEQTWLTGDVMECFLQIPGHEDYFEFHVTPENYTLQLHIQSAEWRAETDFEQKICETGLQTVVRNEPEHNLWCGGMIVPFAGIGLSEAGLNGLSFAVCRYNYNRPQTEPEISSTVRFSGETFHAPSQWHKLRTGNMH